MSCISLKSRNMGYDARNHFISFYHPRIEVSYLILAMTFQTSLGMTSKTYWFANCPCPTLPNTCRYYTASVNLSHPKVSIQVNSNITLKTSNIPCLRADHIALHELTHMMQSIDQVRRPLLILQNSRLSIAVESFLAVHHLAGANFLREEIAIRFAGPTVKPALLDFAQLLELAGVRGVSFGLYIC